MWTITKIFQSTRSQDRDYPMIRLKINTIFQSTRSQDRDDDVGINLTKAISHFNPLGRKTETPCHKLYLKATHISIHSVARPRRTGKLSINYLKIFQSTRSQDRDTRGLETRNSLDISIHSVARPRLARQQQQLQQMYHFNPLGRKTETSGYSVSTDGTKFQSTRSQDRDAGSYAESDLWNISIHSVARPRLREDLRPGTPWTFQSTRSQDRDK